MIRVSAIYPNEPGSRFDARYYLEQHEPFATDMLKPFGLEAIRTALGRSSLDQGPPPFWAISEMVFTTEDQFHTAMEQCGERLFADVPNYTNVTPILQFSEIGAETKP